MRQLITAAALLALLPSAPAAAQDVSASANFQVSLEVTAPPNPDDRVVTITGFENFFDGGTIVKGDSFQGGGQVLFGAINTFCVTTSHNNSITYEYRIKIDQSDYSPPDFVAPHGSEANFSLSNSEFSIPLVVSFYGYAQLDEQHPQRGETISPFFYSTFCDPNAPPYGLSSGITMFAYNAEGGISAPDIPAGIYTANLQVTIAPL